MDEGCLRHAIIFEVLQEVSLQLHVNLHRLAVYVLLVPNQAAADPIATTDEANLIYFTLIITRRLLLVKLITTMH